MVKILVPLDHVDTDTTDESTLVYLLEADLSLIWADLQSWKLPQRPHLIFCFLVAQ